MSGQSEAKRSVLSDTKVEWRNEGREEWTGGR
jgi:hypothetical protein